MLKVLLHTLLVFAIGVPGERIWKKPDWDVEVQDARRIYIVFDGV